MSKQYDATLNLMFDQEPAKWGSYLASELGLPDGQITVLDTDLSSTLQADRLFRVDGPVCAIVHLEIESSGHLKIPERLLRYNVVTRGVYELPVHSVLMLLRPEANASDLTGNYLIYGADKEPYITFRYSVLRVWEKSIEDFFAAGAVLAPLALLTNEADADPQSAFTRLRERLKVEAIPVSLEKKLIGAAFILCGLRYSDELIEVLYRELHMTLEDSTSYQFIFKKGKAEGRAEGKAEGFVEGAQRTIILQGSKRFGSPTETAISVIRNNKDPERLERMLDRVLDATTWDDLLATV